MQDKIYIVIVLYRILPEESPAINSLYKTIKQLTVPYELLIFNNSPDIHIPTSNAYSVVSAENKGIAFAYNYALNQALLSRCTWLMVLDQDTILTKSYFKAINDFLALSPQHNQQIAAAVPLLMFGDQHISPEAYHIAIGPFWKNKTIHNELELQQYKNKHYCITALNSGTLLNTTLLRNINGFPKDFPLDGLDHAYFYNFYKEQMDVFLLSVKLQHSLSLLEQKIPSIERYKSYIHANYLIAKRMKPFTFLSFKWRTCIFFCKSIIYGTPKHIRITLNYLLAKW